MSNYEYRQCVVGVFVNEAGYVLVGERSDVKGAWQLPQGGVEPGESTLTALYREMKEEIGAGEFRVISIASRQVRYQFPATLKSGPAKNYAGQVQQWYKVEFDPGVSWDVSKKDGEFRGFEWRSVDSVIEGIVDWKKNAYREGFRLLGMGS